MNEYNSNDEVFVDANLAVEYAQSHKTNFNTVQADDNRTFLKNEEEKELREKTVHPLTAKERKKAKFLLVTGCISLILIPATIVSIILSLRYPEVSLTLLGTVQAIGLVGIIAAWLTAPSELAETCKNFAMGGFKIGQYLPFPMIGYLVSAACGIFGIVIAMVIAFSVPEAFSIYKMIILTKSLKLTAEREKNI